MTHQDIIYIRAVKVQSLIGILPHERAMKQTLIISCELAVDIRKAARSEAIDDTLNYAAIADFLIQFADSAQYQLLESFAEGLTQALFAAFPAQSITLDISKPGALAATREVGLRIYRERD